MVVTLEPEEVESSPRKIGHSHLRCPGVLLSHHYSNAHFNCCLQHSSQERFQTKKLQLLALPACGSPGIPCLLAFYHQDTRVNCAES